jgi:hypothetical protein
MNFWKRSFSKEMESTLSYSKIHLPQLEEQKIPKKVKTNKRVMKPKQISKLTLTSTYM